MYAYLLAALLASSLVSASPLQKRAAATVYRSCVKDKNVALTFDDGPYQWAKKISDELTRKGAKGTFFYNGNNYGCIYNDDSIDRVKYVYNAGHQVASHTWSHGDLNTFNTDQLHDSMYRVEEALQRIVGVKPAFMRPPYGNYNDNVRNVAGSRGQALAIWDRDTKDADGGNAESAKQVYRNAVNQKPKNMLVLNHETVQFTADSVIPFAIDLLQQNGYKLVTLADCLGVQPYAAVGQPGSKNSAWTCNGAPAPGKACSGSQCKTGTPPWDGGNPPGNSTGRAIHPGKSSSTCLTASSNSNGATVVVKPCDGSSGQSWTQTGGTLTVYGNKCLDVPSGNTANGTKMQIYTCYSGNKNQRFTVTGDARIAWTDMQQCLDLTDGSTASGNRVQMWKCSSGNNNQVWNFA